MRVALFISTLLMTFSGLFAHDLGVANAEFRELTQDSYRLRVKAAVTTQELFASPILPQRCSLLTPPQGRKSQFSIDYEFSCQTPLLSEDILLLPWQREGVMIESIWLDKSSSSQFFPNKTSSIPILMAELNAGSGSLMMVAKRYGLLGIEHIWMGYDHLLFVFALLLLISSTWLLIKTITAFTVAHSITLGLASLGFLEVPILAVEATIALSVAFLAAEIIRYHHYGQSSLTLKAPWLVAFVFGLLHGLGFASALSELGLPDKEIISALLFFNLGVEAGQLMFIMAMALLAVLFSRLFKRKPSILYPVLASAIGVLAMYWSVERSYAIFSL